MKVRGLYYVKALHSICQCVVLPSLMKRQNHHKNCCSDRGESSAPQSGSGRKGSVSDYNPTIYLLFVT